MPIDYARLFHIQPYETQMPRADLFTPLANIATGIEGQRKAELDRALIQQRLAEVERENRAEEADRQARIGILQAGSNLQREKFDYERQQEAEKLKREEERRRIILGLDQPAVAPTPSPTGPVSSVSPTGSYEVAGAPMAAPEPQSQPDIQDRINRVTKQLMLATDPSERAGRQEQLRQLRFELERSPAVVGQKAETEARAKKSVDKEMEMRDAATAAESQVSRYSMLSALADKLDTSAAFPTQVKVGSIAKALGVPEDRLGIIGLKPGDIANAQTFTSLVNEATLGRIGTGGIPSNNFSNKDLDFLREIAPSLGDDPVSIKMKIEIAQRIARRSMEKRDAFKKSGKSYLDFEDDWNRQVQTSDLFGDLGRQAEGLIQRNNPPPSKAGGTTKSGLKWRVE